MRFPQALRKAVLLRRYKRFLADVQLDDGRTVTVHVPNSGSMKTCLPPRTYVWISPQDKPGRKCPWTLEIVMVGVDGDVPAMVNTARPNHLVREGLESGAIPELQGYDNLRSEVAYGTERSRVDLFLSGPGRRDCYVEVKNVTLVEEPGIACFPDSVTTRGTRHLRELEAMVASGARAVQFFLLSRGDASLIRPADHIDPAYGAALRRAAMNGVELLAYSLKVDSLSLQVDRPVPVVLEPVYEFPDHR